MFIKRVNITNTFFIKITNRPEDFVLQWLLTENSEVLFWVVQVRSLSWENSLTRYFKTCVVILCYFSKVFNFPVVGFWNFQFFKVPQGWFFSAKSLWKSLWHVVVYAWNGRFSALVGSSKIEYRLGIRGWVLSFRLWDFNNPQTSENLLIAVVTIQKAVETWGQVDFLWRTVTNQQWIKYQIQSLSGETVSGVS